MASPGNTETDNVHKQSQSQNQTEEDVHDLDDPYLMEKILSQQPDAAGAITCRFSAIPLNEPSSFSTNISQYGHVIHESKDKLIMRVPRQNTDLINYIRQAWVSKYTTPFAECRITIDLPKRDGTTTIIIQRVLAKVSKNAAEYVESKATTEDLGATGSDACGTDDGALPGPSVGEGQDDAPRMIQRVCQYREAGKPWILSWASVLGIHRNYCLEMRMEHYHHNYEIRTYQPRDKKSAKVLREFSCTDRGHWIKNARGYAQDSLCLALMIKVKKNAIDIDFGR
ncbi:hypothetical protein F5Y01DRAFT_325603 [Xylaria sp. FL0043]|nr:hypothetical protein F5Y01DRAFT_325603 [Xylaria sp. FL0043]